MEGEDAPNPSQYLDHWTAEDIAKWEAAKPRLEYIAKGVSLEIRHKIDLIRQEWERRIGTPFPGVSLDALFGMSSWAGLEPDDLKGMNAWEICQAAMKAIESRKATAKDVLSGIQPPSEESDEPEDLYKARVAAHECAHALYEYIRYAVTLLEAGEDPEFEQFKGEIFDFPEITPAELLSENFGIAAVRFKAVIFTLVSHMNVLMDKHGDFKKAFEAIEDELASVYPGLQEISRATGRSHCKALESLAFHVVRYTFDATDRFTPESEVDPKLGPDDAIPFTASNWYPSIKYVMERFPELDVEDHVHEAIEQEMADAWRLRLSRSGNVVATINVEPTATSQAADELDDLTDRERNILEALGDKKMVASDIAKAAGYPYNSAFRNNLSSLVKRKHLKKGPKGVGYLRNLPLS